MSLTRIPLQQVFRSRQKSASVSSRDSTTTISSNSSVSPVEEKISPFSNRNSISTKFAPTAPTTTKQKSRTSNPLTFAQFAVGFGFAGMSSTSSSSPPAMRGTRTPQMLEYERQAEERAREMAQIEEDRARMQEELDKMTREQERIAQEEYEMRQYYEAEALRHAEEMRLHKEEVRRHQERVREHERRIRDHEASAEAFAKVIVMPAKGGRQISFMSPGPRIGNGAGNGAPNGLNGA